jgi:hypothetical protein
MKRKKLFRIPLRFSCHLISHKVLNATRSFTCQHSYGGWQFAHRTGKEKAGWTVSADRHLGIICIDGSPSVGQLTFRMPGYHAAYPPSFEEHRLAREVFIEANDSRECSISTANKKMRAVEDQAVILSYCSKSLEPLIIATKYLILNFSKRLWKCSIVYNLMGWRVHNGIYWSIERNIPGILVFYREDETQHIEWSILAKAREYPSTNENYLCNRSSPFRVSSWICRFQ